MDPSFEVGRLVYPVSMVNVTISLPDEVASRAAALAADRGVTVDELASEALEAYVGSAPQGEKGPLSFVGLGEAANGFSAREAEARLEAEGFQASRSS